MAKYIVKERSYLNNRIYEAGETVDYDGKPGTNLVPVKGKTRGVQEMDKAELLEFADAKGIEVDNPDADEEVIRTEISEALQAESI